MFFPIFLDLFWFSVAITLFLSAFAVYQRKTNEYRRMNAAKIELETEKKF